VSAEHRVSPHARSLPICAGPRESPPSHAYFSRLLKRRQAVITAAFCISTWQHPVSLGYNRATRFLGIADVHGTVEVGKRADLVLLGANPLHDIAAMRNPVRVIQRVRAY
jgi:hypothetical protein